ncbi:MAG: hypothetical protein Ct9H90mP3_3520 [Flammeovirgaceae bacterium]|nr:MAG: hypothetical protein Ct9H90mP3_3520 [Flammeovirgaceae bacterium]
MGWFSGMRLKHLDNKKAISRIPFRFFIGGKTKIHSNQYILLFNVWEQNCLPLLWFALGSRRPINLHLHILLPK